MLLLDKYSFLIDYFRKAILTNKHPLPQCLLFYGNDFESQYNLSKEIARLLNCSKDKANNCDCLNCKWIKENSHPAVITISKNDNKPLDDDSKTVISIKQSIIIKELLLKTSEFHRVLIFCDRDNDGNITGLNSNNFQAETANSLLKIIEEPHPGVTFIFLARYKEDLLSTIVSRSQVFYVPSFKQVSYNYDCIIGVFDNYWEFERKDVFDISQKLTDLTKDVPTLKILESIQNYILNILKTNPKNINFIEHISTVEKAKKQVELGIKPSNIFDELCLKLIK
ncbi:hypothetical protein IKB17_00775 [bacterium]|nr:hypothetical protein [bacterium]